jgi:uncharacterized protein YbcI
MSAMTQATEKMAEQIAQAATAFQQQRTGHQPKSVSVVLGGDTVVVTLHGALSPAEQAMAQSPEGAAKVQEFHRQLFLNSSDSLRQEIKRITGMDVLERSGEVDPTCGPIVEIFPSGTMVQVFLLSGKLPSETFDAENKRRERRPSARQIACSQAWVRRLIQLRRETGSLEPRPLKLPHNNKLDDQGPGAVALHISGVHSHFILDRGLGWVWSRV